jgi:ribosomal protein S18 acetylase RimI-like enzyme
MPTVSAQRNVHTTPQCKPTTPALLDWSAQLEANYCAYVVRLPDATVRDTPQYLQVRTAIPFAYLNAVVCRAVPNDAMLDELISATRAEYRSHGVPLTWYVTPGTTTPDIAATLARHGLVDQRNACMALDLAQLPEQATPAGCTIEEVVSPWQHLEWCWTFVTGFGMPGPMADAATRVLGAMACGPDMPVRRYLVRIDGAPVASATVFVHGESAGIYNVATLPAARGRGIGTAVTFAALRDGVAMGARVGVLHASGMAQSVYRRLGFIDGPSWGCYREPERG